MTTVEEAREAVYVKLHGARSRMEANRITKDAFDTYETAIRAEERARVRELVEAGRDALSHGDATTCWSCGEQWWVSAEMGACKLHRLHRALTPYLEEQTPRG